MKHLIEIDDRTKNGKNLLSLMKTLSEHGTGIDFLGKEVDDPELEALMMEGVKSGLADRKNVLKKLGIE